MQRLNRDTMLTFGGAFSNHIYATAAAGKLFGFKTIGFIRGEMHTPLNSTLAFAHEAGMQLHYLDRAAYRKKDEQDFLGNLQLQFENCYVLPEGGSNAVALKGCTELVAEIDVPFDAICLACGTGATLAGIVAGLKPHQTALGFSALNADGYFENEINRFLNIEYSATANFKILENYHFGGYGKINKDLVVFMDWFQQTFDISLDPVYTGKMMFGVFDLIKKQHFPRGSTIVVVHTGGLQALQGMQRKMEKCRKEQ